MADEDQIIETIDENGNLIKFELFDIVEVDEKEYRSPLFWFKAP